MDRPVGAPGALPSARCPGLLRFSNLSALGPRGPFHVRSLQPANLDLRRTRPRVGPYRVELPASPGAADIPAQVVAPARLARVRPRGGELLDRAERRSTIRRERGER